MKYLDVLKEEMRQLLQRIKKDGKLLEYTDGILYSKNDYKEMIDRVQRQIDGYKTLHSSIDSKRMDFTEYALLRGIAKEEFMYFIEVENRFSSFSINKIMEKAIVESRKGNEENVKLLMRYVENETRKINKRSKKSFSEKWVKDRTFELASRAEFDKEDFKVIPESIVSIHCLPSIMSGKISKDELIKLGLWKNVLISERVSIYTEVGDMLHQGSVDLFIPK